MNSHPVGLSRDLPKNRVMRADVEGVDLAIWRNSKGDLAAWDNRCPHRGMRLSHGFVRGDRLACLYHGWQYGSDGNCAYIPAHPDLAPPQTIRTKSYSVVEEQGVIWVSIDGSASPELSLAGFEALRSFHVGCNTSQAEKTLRLSEGAGATVVEEDGNLIVVGTLKARVLFNPLQDSETLVHVLSEAGATLSQRREVSRWCEAFRRRAEAEEVTSV